MNREVCDFISLATSNIWYYMVLLIQYEHTFDWGVEHERLS